MLKVPNLKNISKKLWKELEKCWKKMLKKSFHSSKDFEAMKAGTGWAADTYTENTLMDEPCMKLT